MGRYQLDKWYGLFWIYDVGYGTLRRRPAASFGSQAGAGRSISSSQMRPGDLIFYTNSGGTINHVALYIGGGRVCHASNARMVLRFPPGITVPRRRSSMYWAINSWKVNKKYSKESREKRQLFPALFFCFIGNCVL